MGWELVTTVTFVSLPVVTAKNDERISSFTQSAYTLNSCTHFESLCNAKFAWLSSSSHNARTSGIRVFRRGSQVIIEWSRAQFPRHLRAWDSRCWWCERTWLIVRLIIARLMCDYQAHGSSPDTGRHYSNMKLQNLVCSPSELFLFA